MKNLIEKLKNPPTAHWAGLSAVAMLTMFLSGIGAFLILPFYLIWHTDLLESGLNFSIFMILYVIIISYPIGRYFYPTYNKEKQNENE